MTLIEGKLSLLLDAVNCCAVMSTNMVAFLLLNNYRQVHHVLDRSKIVQLFVNRTIKVRWLFFVICLSGFNVQRDEHIIRVATWGNYISRKVCSCH